MKEIYQFAANLLSYIPAKYYWNRSTADLVIAKSRRVNFFLKHSVYAYLLLFPRCCNFLVENLQVFCHFYLSQSSLKALQGSFPGNYGIKLSTKPSNRTLKIKWWSYVWLVGVWRHFQQKKAISCHRRVLCHSVLRQLLRNDHDKDEQLK